MLKTKHTIPIFLQALFPHIYIVYYENELSMYTYLYILIQYPKYWNFSIVKHIIMPFVPATNTGNGIRNDWTPNFHFLFVF